MERCPLGRGVRYGELSVMEKCLLWRGVRSERCPLLVVRLHYFSIIPIVSVPNSSIPTFQATDCKITNLQ